MAWRFKASKFKNTTPKQPKKEATLFSIPPSQSNTCNNSVTSSKSLLAYAIESSDGSSVNCCKLGVVPIGARGQCDREKQVSILRPHADQLNDFAFLPFDDLTLVTCGGDNTVKLWKHSCPSEDLTHFTSGGNATNTATIELSTNFENGASSNSAECLATHPNADNILAVGHKNGMGPSVYDLGERKVVIELSHSNSSSTGSLCWSYDGKTLASAQQTSTALASQTSEIFDPRAGKLPVQEFTTHGCCGKETRVLFLGESGKILSSGFTNKRSQEVQVFDIRTLSNNAQNVSPIFTQEFATSTGLLIPLYDVDTRLLFLSGKGSSVVTIMELLDTSAVLGPVCTHLLPSGCTTVGACLSSKQSLDVMQGEVQMLWHLAHGQLTPLPCQVPRRPPRFSLDPALKDRRNILPKKSSDIGKSGKMMSNGTSVDNNENAVLHKPTKTSPPVVRRSSRLADKNESTNPPVFGVNVASRVDSLNNNGVPGIEPTTVTLHADNVNHITEIDIDSGSGATPRQGQKKVSEDDTTFNNSDFYTPAESLTPLAQKTTKFFERDDDTPRIRGPSTQQQNEQNSTPTLTEGKQISPQPEETPENDAENGHSPENSPSEGRDTSVAINVTNVTSNANDTTNGAEISAISEMMDEINDLPIFNEKKIERVRPTRPSMEPRARPVTIVPSLGKNVRHSKYRHLKATPSQLYQFTNVKRVDGGLPGESDGLCVSGKWAALPLAGPPMGMVMVLDLSDPVKLADGVPAALCNGAKVCDLRWSPHMDDLLAIGLADGQVKLWMIPEDGVTDENAYELTPVAVIRASPSKITHIKWHPVAENLLCVACGDGSVTLYDVTGVISSNGDSGPAILEQSEGKMQLENTGMLLSINWSHSGRRLATVGKDKIVRLYKPLESCSPLAEKSEIIGRDRAARCFFACDDRILVVVGFASGGARRQLSLLDGYTLDLLYDETIGEPSSQPLVPHYDFDSSVLFLTTKGERRIIMYELCPEQPHLLPLSDALLHAPTVALALHHKNVCNVANVEFARGWLLTDKTLEQLSFAVPRRETDTFAVDIFPDALVTWRPNGTAKEWLSLVGQADLDGKNNSCKPVFESLKPEGMPIAKPVAEPVANGHHAGVSEKSDPEKSHAKSTRQPEKLNFAQNPVESQKSKPRAVPENCKIVGRRRIAPHHMDEQSAKDLGDDLILSMAERMAAPRLRGKKLEQDNMEGVHEDEWNE